MRRMFQLIQKAVLKYKLHVANGHERAELLRNRFYFFRKKCGTVYIVDRKRTLFN